MVVQVEAIAHPVVGSAFDPKSPSHDLLKAHELDEIARDSKEEVVAPNDLQPF